MARVSEPDTLAPIDEGSRSVSRLSGIDSELSHREPETGRSSDLDRVYSWSAGKSNRENCNDGNTLWLAVEMRLRFVEFGGCFWYIGTRSRNEIDRLLCFQMRGVFSIHFKKKKCHPFNLEEN